MKHVDSDHHGFSVRPTHVLVVGGGVAGLLVATLLAKRGVSVTLVDAGLGATSPHAGGMLAPSAELDHADRAVARPGKDAVARWRALLGEDAPACLGERGSLILAHHREFPLLDQLAQRLVAAGEGEALDVLDRYGVDRLEAGLEGKFSRGIWLKKEGLLDPLVLLPRLKERLLAQGVAWIEARASKLAAGRVELEDGSSLQADAVVDTRGLGAREELPLRGVRGEHLLVWAPDVQLTRPVRLLHPRWPLYCLPRGEGRFYVGATELERDDTRPVTVRSALELLSALYTLHPAFAEAEILDMAAGLRPALPDNAPLIEVGAGLVRLNGLYRHGYLLSPAFAEGVVAVLWREPIDACIAPFVKYKE